MLFFTKRDFFRYKCGALGIVLNWKEKPDENNGNEDTSSIKSLHQDSSIQI